MTYTIGAINSFINKLERENLLEGVKVTSVKNVGLNQMEGNEYIGTVKVQFRGRYRLLKTYFNSSYFDEEDETPEEFLEVAFCLV